MKGDVALICMCFFVFVECQQFPNPFVETPEQHDNLVQNIRALIFGSQAKTQSVEEVSSQRSLLTSSQRSGGRSLDLEASNQGYTDLIPKARTSASTSENHQVSHASESPNGTPQLHHPTETGGQSVKHVISSELNKDIKQDSIFQELKSLGVNKILDYHPPPTTAQQSHLEGSAAAPSQQINGSPLSPATIATSNRDFPAQSANGDFSALVKHVTSSDLTKDIRQDPLFQHLRSLGVHKIVENRPPTFLPPLTIQKFSTEVLAKPETRQSTASLLSNAFGLTKTGQSSSVRVVPITHSTNPSIGQQVSLAELHNHQALLKVHNLQTPQIQAPQRISIHNQQSFVQPTAQHQESILNTATSQVSGSDEKHTKTEITKSVFIHVAPDMPAPPPIQIQSPSTPQHKHYSIVLVKVPTHKFPEIRLPEVGNKNEEKTLIYVLQPNPSAPEVPVLKVQNNIKPQNPDVFLIKYDTESPSGPSSNGGSVSVSTSLTHSGSASIGLSNLASLSAATASQFGNVATISRPQTSNTAKTLSALQSSLLGTSGSSGSLSQTPITFSSSRGGQDPSTLSLQGLGHGVNLGGQFSVSSPQFSLQGFNGHHKSSSINYRGYPRTQRRVNDNRSHRKKFHGNGLKGKLHEALFGEASHKEISEELETSFPVKVMEMKDTQNPKKKVTVMLKAIRPVTKPIEPTTAVPDIVKNATATDEVIVSAINGSSGMGVVPDIKKLMASHRSSKHEKITELKRKATFRPSSKRTPEVLNKRRPFELYEGYRKLRRNPARRKRLSTLRLLRRVTPLEKQQ